MIEVWLPETSGRLLRLALPLTVLVAGCATAPTRTENQVEVRMQAGWPAKGDLTEICAQVRCRPSGIVKLRLDERQTAEIATGQEPIVFRDEINLLPGETIFVEAREEGDRLIDLRWVEKPLDESRTLVFELAQPAEDRGVTIMLRVKNPFARTLKYRAGTLRPGAREARATSTCPVRPGLLSFEMWPYPLLRVFVRDLHFVAEESRQGRVCEY